MGEDQFQSSEQLHQQEKLEGRELQKQLTLEQMEGISYSNPWGAEKIIATVIEWLCNSEGGGKEFLTKEKIMLASSIDTGQNNLSVLQYMLLILDKKWLIDRVENLPFGVLHPQLKRFHKDWSLALNSMKEEDQKKEEIINTISKDTNLKRSVNEENIAVTENKEVENTQLTLEIQTLKDRYEQMKALRTENQLEEISTEEQANASFAKMGIEPEQVKEKLAANDKWKSRDMNSTQLATFMDTVFQLQQSWKPVPKDLAEYVNEIQNDLQLFPQELTEAETDQATPEVITANSMKNLSEKQVRQVSGLQNYLGEKDDLYQEQLTLDQTDHLEMSCHQNFQGEVFNTDDGIKHQRKELWLNQNISMEEQEQVNHLYELAEALQLLQQRPKELTEVQRQLIYHPDSYPYLQLDEQNIPIGGKRELIQNQQEQRQNEGKHFLSPEQENAVQERGKLAGAKIVSEEIRVVAAQTMLSTIGQSFSYLMNDELDVANQVRIKTDSMTINPDGSYQCQLQYSHTNALYTLQISPEGEVYFTNVLWGNQTGQFANRTEALGIQVPSLQQLEQNGMQSFLQKDTLKSTMEKAEAKVSEEKDLLTAFREQTNLTLETSTMSYFTDAFRGKQDLVQEKVCHQVVENNTISRVMRLLNDTGISTGEGQVFPDMFLTGQDSLDKVRYPEAYPLLKLLANTTQQQTVTENEQFLGFLERLLPYLVDTSANLQVGDHLFQKTIAGNPDHEGTPQGSLWKLNQLLTTFAKGSDPHFSTLEKTPEYASNFVDTSLFGKRFSYIEADYANGATELNRDESFRKELRPYSDGQPESIPDDRVQEEYLKNNFEHRRRLAGEYIRQFQQEHKQASHLQEASEKQADQPQVASVENDLNQKENWEKVEAEYSEQIKSFEQQIDGHGNEEYITHDEKGHIVRNEVHTKPDFQHFYEDYLSYLETGKPKEIELYKHGKLAYSINFEDIGRDYENNIGALLVYFKECEVKE